MTEAKLAALGVTLNEVEPRVRSMEDLPEDGGVGGESGGERTVARGDQKILAGLTKM